jgi:hypothetical protein
MPVDPVNTSFQAYTQTAREAREEGGADFLKDLLKGVSFVGGVAVRGLSVAVSKSSPGAGALLGGLGGGGLGGGAGGLAGVDPNDPASLLNLQIQMQRELQIFSMLSNIAKTEHETQMAAVRNMRP